MNDSAHVARWERCWMLLPILMIAAGCGGDYEEIEQMPIVEEHADAMFPIMLHGRVIRHGAYAWKLQYDDLTEVELHERSEKASDGTRTATLSFTMESTGRRVKLDLVYEPVEGQPGEDEFSVASFPVKEIKVLSIE